MSSQQNLYDYTHHLCNIFWWFKDVINVGEMNVCQHNIKLRQCANISLRYIGLYSSKHLKCMHLESIVHTKFLLFSSFNSHIAIFYKSYEAKGA